MELLLAPDAPKGTSRTLKGACERATRALQERLWSQLGLKLEPTWSQLGTNLRPSWSQVGAKLGQLGAKLGQLEAKLGQLEPT